MRSLSGQVMVITGASSGIGAATARACADAGMRLVIGARREDRLEAVADELRGGGAAVATVVGDVLEPTFAARLLGTAIDVHGRYDVVFANAGTSVTRPIHDMSADELRWLFDVNFFAAAELLRDAARGLLDAGRGGHLLMCSSCVSRFAIPLQGAYAATKAAQHMVCSAMRHELRDAGIHVSSVHPITTTTEFFAASAEASGLPAPDGPPAHAPKLFVQPPERVAKAVVRCLRRPRPEVWTSHIVRIVAGFMTMFPSFYERSIAKQAKKELEEWRSAATERRSD